MGWWAEGELTLGDEPIDRLIDALDRVRAVYRDEVGRDPTHAEVARFTEAALRSVLDAASPDARVDAAVKIRSTRMKKQRVQVGDVFVIPLDRYHYGRVVKIDNCGTRIELYRQTSDRPLPVRRIDTSPTNVKHHKWVLARWVFEDGRWKVIGNVPVPADYEFPDYLMGLGEQRYGTRGSDDKTWFFPTDEEILERHLEPIVLFPRETIEANLRAGHEDPWPDMVECLVERGVKPELIAKATCKKRKKS